MKTPLIILAALGLAPAGAIAAPSDVSINYSDLDLTRDADVKILDRRIRTAAKEHCLADSAQTGSRMQAKGTSECVRKFETAAKEQFAAILQKEGKGG